MAIDPVGVDEGNIHSFNRYAYANNNPYKFVDPDGKLPFLVAFVLKEIAGEAFEQITGIPAPSLKNAGKGAAKALAKKGDGGADFIVDGNGTAVRNSASGARRDLEAGGFPGKATTETLESGTMHRGVPGRDGPMDVRIMDGQANGGSLKGPRVRTTRSGSDNDGVRSDGSRFRNNESKSQRLRESHIQLGNK